MWLLPTIIPIYIQQPPNTARYQSHQAKCSSVLCGVKCDTPCRETVGNSWKLLKSQAKFKNLHPMKHVIPGLKILSQNEGVKLKYLSSSPNSMWRKEIQILDNLLRRFQLLGISRFTRSSFITGPWILQAWILKYHYEEPPKSRKCIAKLFPSQPSR